MSTILDNLRSTLTFAYAKEHGYSPHHTPGLNYICLFRDPRLTIKLYIIENEVVWANECPPGPFTGQLVHPHNHAYEFNTEVIKGQVRNITFYEEWFEKRASDLTGFGYSKYLWDTPLNGGNGEKWIGSAELCILEDDTFEVGGQFYTDTDDIHTLTLPETGTTVLLQTQHADKLDQSHMYVHRDYEPVKDCTYGKLTKSRFDYLLGRLDG